MKKYISICLLCLTAVHGIAQTVLYEEHFDKNKRKWPAGEDQWAIRRFKGGKYYLECKGHLMPISGTAWSVVPELTLPTDNFVMECTTRWVMNRNNNGYYHGYGFGLGDYTFQLYGNGDRTLHQWNGKNDVELKGFAGVAPTPFTKGPVVVKIMVKNGTAYMYANGNLLFSQWVNQFKGGQLKFIIRHSEAVEFDDLVIRTLSAEEQNKSPLELTKADVKQLLTALNDTLVRNGIVIPAHPDWKRDQDIKAGKGRFYKFGEAGKTLPWMGQPFGSLEFRTSVGPGTLASATDERSSVAMNALGGYYRNMPYEGKNLTRPTDKDQATKADFDRVFRSEPFTTSDGMKAQLITYHYWEVSGQFISAKLLAYVLVADPGGSRVASLSLDLSSIDEVKYHDFGQKSIFRSTEQENDWTAYVRQWLKGVKVRFAAPAVVDVKALVAQCTDTIAKDGASVRVNPKWKAMNTGFGPGSITTKELWKAKETFPITQRMAQFHIGLSITSGNLSQTTNSSRTTHSYELKAFYKAADSGMAEDALKAAVDAHTAAHFTVEDITNSEGAKGKFIVREYPAIFSDMVYYRFEAVAVFERSSQESVKCTVQVSDYRSVDAYTVKKTTLIHAADERKAMVDFCRELFRTVKVR